ncbi:hypothetical protein Q0812_10440 [Brevundimonas sp. 2R-24]|uniref:Uncharacterized protein n=1 Tax=Peiella sedimenti TaxID=3061083 RepID=A0ABT8SMQ5_9CAUL|nr:hypothetical protein [Caulobacteraceae bacterium XZ-24]
MGRREIINSGLLAAITLGGGAVVTALSTTATAYTPYLLSVGWIALLGGAAGLMYMLRTAPRAAINAMAPTPPREFLDPDITWDVLSKKVEGRTSLQVEALNKTYAGKWMRVSGTVYDVKRIYGDLCGVDIRLNSRSYGSVLACFGKQANQQLAALNKGDSITIVGKVERLKGGGTMGDCEIEHVGPPPEKPKPKPRRRAAASKSAG